MEYDFDAMKENEQEELLRAALKLAEYVCDKESLQGNNIRGTIDAILKFRPELVKRVAREFWVNLYGNDTSHRLWTIASDAERAAGYLCEEPAVHVREVLPDEDNKPERWYHIGRVVHTIHNTHLFNAENPGMAELAVDEHNRAIGREEA